MDQNFCLMESPSQTLALFSLSIYLQEWCEQKESARGERKLATLVEKLMEKYIVRNCLWTLISGFLNTNLLLLLLHWRRYRSRDYSRIYNNAPFVASSRSLVPVENTKRNLIALHPIFPTEWRSSLSSAFTFFSKTPSAVSSNVWLRVWYCPGSTYIFV